MCNLVAVLGIGDEISADIVGLVYFDHNDIRCNSGMNLAFQRPAITKWSVHHLGGSMRFYLEAMILAVPDPTVQYRPRSFGEVRGPPQQWGTLRRSTEPDEAHATIRRPWSTSPSTQRVAPSR